MRRLAASIFFGVAYLAAFALWDWRNVAAGLQSHPIITVALLLTTALIVTIAAWIWIGRTRE